MTPRKIQNFCHFGRSPLKAVAAPSPKCDTRSYNRHLIFTRVRCKINASLLRYRRGRRTGRGRAGGINPFPGHGGELVSGAGMLASILLPSVLVGR